MKEPQSTHKNIFEQENDQSLEEHTQLAPLPSLSCTFLECRGALFSWLSCPGFPAHPLDFRVPSPAGPPAHPVLHTPWVSGHPLQLDPCPAGLPMCPLQTEALTL